MKISVYVDVQDSDDFAFIRGLVTDSVTAEQKTIPAKWLPVPHRSYRIMFDIPDLANKVHRIDVKQENVEEVKELEHREGME